MAGRTLSEAELLVPLKEAALVSSPESSVPEPGDMTCDLPVVKRPLSEPLMTMPESPAENIDGLSEYFIEYPLEV